MHSAFQLSGTGGLEDVCGIWKCVGEEIILMPEPKIILMPEPRIGNVFKSYTLGKTKIY